jgi:SAM-dependent methyltransferase
MDSIVSTVESAAPSNLAQAHRGNQAESCRTQEITMTEHVPPDWYAEFFTELPNEFWRRVVPPQATESEVDFIENRLGLKPPSRVVDVPCGSGRHTLTLAARGHDVVGVDISTEAVDHARRAAADAGLDVELVVAEMRDIPRDGSFDAAVCMGNSFGYLDLDGLREFVAALAAAVRSGGGLVVDFSAAAESVLPGFVDDQPRDMTVGDITVTGSNTYDVAGSRLLSSYVFTRGAQQVKVTALHHVYTVAHLRQLLVDGGFADIKQYGGPNSEPFEVGTGRLLLTARRNDRLAAPTAHDHPRSHLTGRFS